MGYPCFTLKFQYSQCDVMLIFLLLRIMRHPLEDDDITLVFFSGVQLATDKEGRFLYVFDRAESQTVPARLPAIALVV